MEHLSLYLDKFKKFGFEDQILKEALIGVVKGRFGADIDKSDISLKEGIVRINVSGPLKSELFLYKDKIQKEVIEILGDDKQIKELK